MDVEIIEVPTQLVAMERKSISVDEIPTFFDRVFHEVMAAVSAANGTVVGPPFGWYHGMPTGTAAGGDAVLDAAAGFPVSGVGEGPLQGDIEVVERPGGSAAVAMHVGPYDALAETYEKVSQYIAARDDLTPRDEMWEEYLSEPSGDPSTWQTRIVQPLS